jgi:hypothetical protein
MTVTATRSIKAKPSRGIAVSTGLRKVFQMCRELSGSEDYAPLISWLKKQYDCDAASVYLLSAKSEMKEVATFGDGVELVSFVSIGQGGGLSGYAAEHQEPILLTNRSPKRSFDPDTHCATFVSMPLPGFKKTIGAINLGWYPENAIDRETVDSFQDIAPFIGMALETRRAAYLVQKLTHKSNVAQTKSDNLAGLLDLSRKAGAISETASSINHQINNPLAVILGNIQCLLLEKPADNQKSLSRLRRIEKAALKISRVNQELTEIHRFASELSELSAKLVNQRKG